MGFLLDLHEVFMGFLWDFFYDIPWKFLWESYKNSMIFYWISMTCLWGYYGGSMVFLWDFFGSPIAFP